jgi:ribosomal protein S18 acetylase RimI-like enzyme
LGLGKRLCEALLRKSQDRGYRLMRLDTGDLQTEAQSLYRSMGFKEIKPYYELHEDIRPYFIFMERALSD